MILTDEQLEETAQNAKAYFYERLQSVYTTLQTHIDLSEQKSVEQGNREAGLYISALDSDYVSNADKNTIANRLAEMGYNRSRLTGYVENGYWESGYSD